jgi:hypothetical protein
VPSTPAQAFFHSNNRSSEALGQNPEPLSRQHLVEAEEAEIKKKRGTTLPYFSSELQGYEVNGNPISE